MAGWAGLVQIIDEDSMDGPDVAMRDPESSPSWAALTGIAFGDAGDAIPSPRAGSSSSWAALTGIDYEDAGAGSADEEHTL